MKYPINAQDITVSKGNLADFKQIASPNIPIINCDSWKIIGIATEEDKKRAKKNIIERIKNAFWL